MRFGQQLRTSLIKDWYYYYISYDDLKNSLKKAGPGDASTTAKSNGKQRKPPVEWNEEDEQRFVRELEQELDKVHTFQQVKSEEIVRRIRASEKEVNDAISRAEQANSGGRVEAPTEDDFMLLEEDLSDIIADVHDLAKFTQLNYTGFQKIIKKHDKIRFMFLEKFSAWLRHSYLCGADLKVTSWHLKPVFATRLRSKPFFNANYDALIVKLSKLYDLVRTRGNPTKGDSSAGGSQQNFVRQTTKYWVHPDNITELKLIILKHLPVLVFNASKEFDPKDSAISSIYYDNTDTWELYTGRLKKTEGAEAIRLRWYGGMESDTIFVERKTHREDWTGEKSVKARFALKEKNVNAFLAGNMTVEQVFEKMRKEGKKSEKEIADLEQLAREIQYRVITRKLVPVTRSFYNRTAFQLPGDARVRISLDTELTMTREDNLDGRQRTGKNWRRMDIGIDYPFPQLPPEDAERFPYAVLEVKLQTQMGQEPPQWIRELTASHLVEAVPKFSKFIHGTAKLQPKRIHLLPFWMPQMDVDIRKPISRRFGIERPNQSADISTNGPFDDDESDVEDNLELPETDASDNEDLRRLRAARDMMEQHDEAERRDYATQNGKGTPPVNSNQAANREPGPNELDVEERIAARPLSQAEDDYPLYDSEDESDDLEEAKRVGGWTYRRKLVEHNVVRAVERTWDFLHNLAPKPRAAPMPNGVNGGMGVPRATGEVKRFKAPKGKRIHVPVRVEPKVYFAAERTFLSWLEFSIILGSIAATLLNFGDGIALASAWAFTIIACLALLYSMGLYLWRVDKIRNRRAVRYHDKYGPTALCIGLFCAVLISFAMRMSAGEDGWKGGLKDGMKG